MNPISAQPKPRGGARRARDCGGFSLPEVSLAVGIVAAVVLPTLALLATGTRLSRSSTDQELAARVTSETVSRVRTAADGSGFEFLPGFGAPPLPLPMSSGSGESWYGAFSPKGEFLRAVETEEFRSGLPPGGDALLLVALGIERVDLGSPPVEVSLYRLEIAAEIPASSPPRNRERLVFSTRLAGP